MTQSKTLKRAERGGIHGRHKEEAFTAAIRVQWLDLSYEEDAKPIQREDLILGGRLRPPARPPDLIALTRPWGLRWTPSRMPLRNTRADPGLCSSLPDRDVMGSVPRM